MVEPQPQTLRSITYWMFSKRNQFHLNYSLISFQPSFAFCLISKYSVGVHGQLVLICLQIMLPLTSYGGRSVSSPRSSRTPSSRWPVHRSSSPPGMLAVLASSTHLPLSSPCGGICLRSSCFRMLHNFKCNLLTDV